MVASPMTLSAALWPQRGAWRAALLALLGSALIALCAQVSIPLWPVPVTGQTFAVLLVGALLGRRLGVASVVLYLAEGAAGLPVFAGGVGGAALLLGPTAGYLWGFVLAAALVGALAERGWERTRLRCAVAMLLGNAAIYACGLPWLALTVGAERVLPLGLFPFLLGDALKVGLAALALPGGWALLGRR